MTEFHEQHKSFDNDSFFQLSLNIIETKIYFSYANKKNKGTVATINFQPASSEQSFLGLIGAIKLRNTCTH